MRPANWIVSYPRSGNTFVRSLLANYFSQLDRPLTLAEIVESTRGEHNESLWTELTGKQTTERSFEEQWNARTLYFERLRTMTGEAVPLIKSHTVLADINGRPGFQFVPGDRIINIVRHPCEVALSVGNFYNIGVDEAIERMLTTNISIRGHPEYGYEFMGSWAQHVRSWMQESIVPIHRIRYLDLVEKPVDMLVGIIGYLNFKPALDRARLAVEFAAFDRLKSEETKRGFAENLKSSAQPFFREGRSGRWRDALTADQAGKILKAEPQLIDLFGFERL